MVTRDPWTWGSPSCTLAAFGKAHIHFPQLAGFHPARDRRLYTPSISWPNFHFGRNGDSRKSRSGSGPPGFESIHFTGRVPSCPASHPHEGAVGSAGRRVRQGHCRRYQQSDRPRVNIAVASSPPGVAPRLPQSPFHHFDGYNWDTHSGAPSLSTSRRRCDHANTPGNRRHPPVRG